MLTYNLKRFMFILGAKVLKEALKMTDLYIFIPMHALGYQLPGLTSTCCEALWKVMGCFAYRKLECYIGCRNSINSLPRLQIL